MAFKSAGLAVPGSRLDSFFNDIDMNNDGYISFDEWRYVYSARLLVLLFCLPPSLGLWIFSWSHAAAQDLAIAAMLGSVVRIYDVMSHCKWPFLPIRSLKCW
jgi:hypothetical protein